MLSPPNQLIHQITPEIFHQIHPHIKTQAITPLVYLSFCQTIPKTTFPTSESNIKNMSTAEMQHRHAKGLCYTCDEKFSPTHRCPNKQYLYLYVEDLDDPPIELEPPDLVFVTGHDVVPEHHLSFNALKVSCGLGTMQFQGSIYGISVQILVDSGSSDNFLQPHLTHHLWLSIEPISSFQVLVGMAILYRLKAWLKMSRSRFKGITSNYRSIYCLFLEQIWY